MKILAHTEGDDACQAIPRYVTGSNEIIKFGDQNSV